MTYATKKRANAAIEAAGFAIAEVGVMGAAQWRNGASYAWVTEDWSPRHKANRFTVHIAQG